MNENKALYQEFLKSRKGRVYAGKQAFRNFMGRCLHGITRHPCKMGLMGVLAFPASALNPVFFAPLAVGVLGGFLGGVAKGEEKTAREFLMNVAIRKSNVFKEFLDEKGVPDAVKASAIDYCLKRSSPLFGGFKEFKKEMPDAVSKIMNSTKEDDLPFYRTKAVLRNELMQKLFTKRGSNGGIWQGFKNFFSGEEKIVRQMAEQQVYGDNKTPEKQSLAQAANQVSVKNFLQTMRNVHASVPKTDANLPQVKQDENTSSLPMSQILRNGGR